MKENSSNVYLYIQYTYIHTYIYLHTYIYIHTYIHTYIYRWLRHVESQKIEREKFLATQPPPEVQPRYIIYILIDIYIYI
jgi:hypothetical protein